MACVLNGSHMSSWQQQNIVSPHISDDFVLTCKLCHCSLSCINTIPRNVVERVIFYEDVHPSVSPSDCSPVCLSHSCTMPKRFNTFEYALHASYGRTMSFLRPNVASLSLELHPERVRQTEAPPADSENLTNTTH